MSKLLSLPAIGLGLGLIGCSTTSDVTYADRNNVDVARSRCVEVARTIGYSDVLSIPSKGMVRLSGKFDQSRKRTEKTVKNAANMMLAQIQPVQMIKRRCAKKQRDGSDRELAYQANAETRMMIQRVILAEYEKIVGKAGAVPSVRSASERLRALEQLKNDGLIN